MAIVQLPRSAVRLLRQLSAIVAVVVIVLVLLSAAGRTPRFLKPRPQGWIRPESESEVTTVIASVSKDDMTWLVDAFPQWNHRIYVTDNPRAELPIPVNKGREAMVYLSHIIDNYDSLSPVTIFRHAQRYQWHSDDPLYDGRRVLQRLQLSYVEEVGYTSLRCAWILGCPDELFPFIEEQQYLNGEHTRTETGSYYKGAFEQLFPDEDVPGVVATPCCAEFAVTRSRIHERPRSDYERYREWIVETRLPDDVSGRVLEYAWHIIFGRPAVDCPDASACYCLLYGLCDLVCEGIDMCGSQYTLPNSTVLPKGWPHYDAFGRWQNASAM